ncbi:MAG TPA: VIT and VWA domain-containing protein [Terriglobales bacterium]|nr:VIT and VWA domain-containing protein [Terriglobales bacterium]
MKNRTTRRQRYPFYLLGAALLFLVALTATPVWTLPPVVSPPGLPQDPAQTVTQTPPHGQSSYSSKEKLPPAEASDGSLQIVREREGRRMAADFCPLKHTDVDAEISGFMARVTVTQEFVNPSSDKVEAIYIFPLPQDAAVDDMTMEVGGRIIRGSIKKKEEAQQIYQAARNAGHTAALLDQERPNIFTQSVANIPSGSTVKVKISYFEVLKYEAGVYEFVYPMVVGPRYIPGNIVGKQGRGWSHDTDQVPDASRITPLAAGVHRGVRGSRAGHDISLEVRLDAGVDIREMKSLMHEVDISHRSSSRATVRLRQGNEIPNRDFVLKYDVAGARVADALLTHASGRGRGDDRGGGDSNATRGFFSFILQPPDRVTDEDATPRELIFVLDTSGSMEGFPLETAKKTMKRAIENMRAGDTFNFITFAGETKVLFPQPVTANTANIRQAIAFLESRRGGGGTEMMKAIRTALGDRFDECPKGDCAYREDALREKTIAKALRVVCFMTDGYVGNDMAIIDEVQKHPEARVFSFGIGTSVNRFLLDKMAEAGRGEAEFVLRAEDAEKAADRFYERVHTPVLTDVTIDWNGLPVTDVLPARSVDLFSAKPVVLTGRYTYPASGVIKLRGNRGGKPFERQIKVTLPGEENANQSLAQLWARTKIHDLMSQDWNGVQNGAMKPALQQAVTQLGLDYRLMTQFTSFVAVEDQVVVEGGRTRTIQVPVEVPQGVNPNTAYGAMGGVIGGVAVNNMPMAAPVARYQNGIVVADQTVEVTASAGSVQSSTSTLSGRVMGAKKSDTHVSQVGSTGVFAIDGAEAPSMPDDRQDKDRLREEAKLEKAKRLETKLHPSLMAVYECWMKSGRNKSASCAGLQNGMVKAQIFLTFQSADVMKHLQQKGFFAAPNVAAAGNRVEGTFAIEKLEDLLALPEVKLIALQK